MAKNIVALIVGVIIGFCAPAKGENIDNVHSLEVSMTRALLNYNAARCVSIGQTRKQYVEQMMHELGY